MTDDAAAVPRLCERAEAYLANASGEQRLAVDLVRDLLAAVARLTQERDQLTAELEQERHVSLNDPAEQRAERYASEASELTRRLIAAEQEQAQGERARQLIADILEERRDELDKAACDRCEQCGEFVMCNFHSVLSSLARHTWTLPAIERHNTLTDLRRRLRALEQWIRLFVAHACDYDQIIRQHQEWADQLAALQTDPKEKI